MKIRPAQDTDLNSIWKIIETAFSGEDSNALKNFASDLLSEVASPPIKSLVAEMHNQVIGYVSYSPIFLTSDANVAVGYILSPLAVSPAHQKQGVGSNLINTGIDTLAKEGVDILLVYGDPAYYGRFGFKEEVGHSLVPPYPLEYPFGWIGMMLNGAAVPETPIKFECVQALNKPDLW